MAKLEHEYIVRLYGVCVDVTGKFFPENRLHIKLELNLQGKFFIHLA